MKVGIFFSKEADQAVSTVLRLCRKLGIDAGAYRFRGSWGALHPDEVSFNFGSLTHIMLRGTPEVLGAAWLPFVAGFALGRHRESCLLGPLGEAPLPAFLRQLSVLEAPPEIEEYLAGERLMLQRENALEAAREEIRVAGLPETEDAFSGAVTAGRADLVESFLRVGFSPDSRDPKGVPVLVLAIRNNNPDVGELLLSRKADPNAVSEDRGTTALMEAASLGNTDLLRLLLSHGADPDIKSKSGRTALMLAVSEGNREPAEALLEAGAGTDIVDDLGMTALGYAKLFKLEDLFESTDQT